MPEITVIHIALLALLLVIGIIVGWLTRSSRCVKEKSAINAGWQEQLAAQRNEHDRLGQQNKNLMQQISQFQASNKDAKLRTKELSDALKETYERRDELQRQVKDIRNDLEVAVRQRNELQSDIDSRKSSRDVATGAIKEKDEKIFKLSRELDNWQNRLPPLIERFRQRNEEAKQLEADLAAAREPNEEAQQFETDLIAAREQINALQAMLGSDQTRVEPVNRDSLAEHLDASNDSLEVSIGTQSEEEAVEHGLGNARANNLDDPIEASNDAEEDDEVNSLIENLHETATNELLRDLDYLANSLNENEEADAVLARESLDSAANDRPNGEPADDLQLIKGVGPAIEKTLNEMGIFRFDQIAQMSGYEIDRVANRLKGFHSRIYREDWIGQARNLQDQKINGQL